MIPYYEDDAVTIYHGDCMDVLPTLSGRGPGRAVPGGRRPLAGHHQPARLAVMRQKNWFPESKKR